MSEIQSAEEFVKFIDDNYINLGAMTKQTITDLLLARDKAIVWRVFEIVYDKCGLVPELNHFTIDDVLRELGGEQ
jgi:hypothetical protein